MQDFIFSEYRRRILGLLLLHPEMRYHVREIARLTHTRAESIHRDLSKLAEAKILTREVSGRQVYYQANTHFLIFNELASIFRKTYGLAEIIKKALAPLGEKIDVAFIFGSVGRGTETLYSDIDILIIGEISFTEAVKLLYPCQSTLGREINPKVYQREEWLKLVNRKEPFVQEIIKNPKIFLIGAEYDIK